jgi:DNA polymerase/3'-5' exonuclease PolX
MAVPLPSATAVVDLTTDAVSATATAAASSRRFFRRITVRLVPWSARACATLYYTGPEAFHRRLSEAAAARGLALSEYAIVRTDSGAAVRVDSEADVFAAIGVENADPGRRV